MNRPRAYGAAIRPTLLGLLLAFAGCSSATEGGKCLVDSDCASATYCNIAQQTCVYAATSIAALEVRPPSDNTNGQVDQEFNAPQPDDDGTFTLQLAPSISAQGRIYGSDAPDTAIPSTIVALRASDITGREVQKVEVSTLDPRYKGDPGATTAKGEYVLWLIQGKRYTFHVSPRSPFDESYPTAVHAYDMNEHRQLDFELDGADKTVEVSGRVSEATGTADAIDPLPFSAQIRAIGETDGAQSTVGQICGGGSDDPSYCCEAASCLGSYRFRIPQRSDLQSYTIQIESIPSSSSSFAENTATNIPLIPTVECRGVLLGLVDMTKSTATQALTTIRLPPFQYAQQYTLSLRGTAQPVQEGKSEGKSDGKSETSDLAGIQVQFSAQLPMDDLAGLGNCTAVYQRTAISDSEGRIQLPLLPGTAVANMNYQITINPPPSSPWAGRLISAYDVGPAGVLPTIQLDRRHLIAGRIVNPQGLPVPYAAIETDGVANESGDTRGRLPAKSSATSDREGLFSLYVDSGIYNIHVRAPSESGLASHTFRQRQIIQDVDGWGITLSTGRLLRGRAATPQSGPAEGFAIRVYELPSGPADGTTAEGLGPIVVAQSTTDASGEFRIVVDDPIVTGQELK